MPIELICPVSGTPLRLESGALTSAGSGRRYPIVDGIPILLADDAERKRVLESDWVEVKDATGPLDFYNKTTYQESYCRPELPEERADLIRLLERMPGRGPVLDIGSGMGALQGIAEDYVAFDYSYTALKRFIHPGFQRVCGSVERLPFPDRSVRLVCSVTVLEHVPDAARAFAEIDRVLQPGGIAFLAPAWHCMQDNCEGIPVRPYGELTARQRLRKATLPLRTMPAFKGAVALPGRLARRARWLLGGRGPVSFQSVRLRPDYSRFWMSDSDAVSRLDSHEGCLFFHSRSYELLRPGPAWWRQLMMRYGAVVARKPL